MLNYTSPRVSSCLWLFALINVLIANVTSVHADNIAKVSGDWSLNSDCSDGYELQLKGASGEGVLSFNMKSAPLDLSHFSHVTVDLKNKTQADLDVRLFATSEKVKNDRYVSGRFLTAPGEERSLPVLLNRDYFPKDNAWTQTFGRIRGLPGGHFSNWRYLDTSKMRKVELTVSWSGLDESGGTVVFSKPKGSGAYTTDQLTPDDLPQPLLDPMGQLVNEEWDGRVNDVAELAADGVRDLAKYANHPVMSGFTEYGGWKDGPRFDATGHFYTKKVDGKWWFVDPQGYLFWSLGVTGVGGGAVTPIEGRERFFPDLSDSEFWREENFSRGYDFTLGNLFRKYGEDWEHANQQVTFGRMRSWGLNSTGAWSVSAVLGNGMVPYTIIIHPKLQVFGKLDKIPDPFSPIFRKSLQRELAKAAEKYAGDPWNLGVFIDNELHWGKGTQVAREVINLESTVPAKKAMVELYKKKYGKIGSLNKAWGSDFADFDSIRSVAHKQAKAAYNKDLELYVDYHANTYFAYCAAVLEKYMPGHLYLGCRFHGSIYNRNNTIVQNAASRHVDVMSYNIYKNSILDVITDQEVDRPILIGEFHFGTGSHGVWGSGLVACSSMEDQAALYQVYVEEAVEHPSFVGAHWFKWSDHPTTGRYDGENYRIGFVSIVDRSYDTLTNAIQNTAKQMYPLRNSAE
jgi:hypothetical protein